MNATTPILKMKLLIFFLECLYTSDFYFLLIRNVFSELYVDLKIAENNEGEILILISFRKNTLKIWLPSPTLVSLSSYCREIMALNVPSAGGMEGLFNGSNLSKWLRSGEQNTQQQKIWKCLLVSLKCLLLASRGPAGLGASGSLWAEPHLPDNCECYVPLMESCSQKMVLEACATITPQIPLLCKSLKWQ